MCDEPDIIQDSADYLTCEEYQNLVKKNQEVLRNPRYGNTGCGVSSLGIQNILPKSEAFQRIL